jgi:hypothetical protein
MSTPKKEIDRLKAYLAANKGKPLVESAKNFPTGEELASMDGLAFLELRLSNYEPWDDDAERVNDEIRVHAIRSDRSERGKKNASNPRPSRRHPRADEAIKIARGIWKTNPNLSRNAVATRTAAKMDGDNIPSPRTVERYLKKLPDSE